MRIGLFLRILTIFIFIGTVFSCARKEAEEKSVQSYASLSDSTAYAGKEACRQCHADKYETFIHTGMGLSIDSATRIKSSARFSAHDLVYDKHKNFYYYPHWQNDRLLLTEFRLKGSDTVYSRTEEISYIVGSGQHTNSHMIDVNGYLYQAPATFYTQKATWDLPPGFENGYNTRFSRMIELECMSCHNAYPEIVAGSMNKFTAVPSGIDCERCHGPGSRHISDKQKGLLVDVKKDIDFSIVNPAKLPVELQLDVCQRCHIQGNAVLEKDKSFLDFKPGMHLSQVMNVYMPVYEGNDNEHIMASHVERMKLSRCYTESVKLSAEYNSKHPSIEPYKNAMTCVTCHNPHVSVRVTENKKFNDACLSCHHKNEAVVNINPAISVSSCSLPLSERMKLNNNCAGCHMPHNGALDIPHVTTTDHWIRKPVTKKETEDIRKFVTLACINNPSPGNRSRGIAFLSYFEKFVSNPAFLDSAKKYLQDDDQKSIIANFNELIRWAFLKNDYPKVIFYVSQHGHATDSLEKKSYSNDDAWTAYRIGESFYKTNDLQAALNFYEKSVQLAPFIPDFRNKLAGCEQDAGQTDAAVQNYEFIIKENPGYASAYISYGYLVLSQKHDIVKADRLYDKALSIDPDNIQALINKAGSMIYLNKKSEAERYLRRVLEIQPDNAPALNILSRIKHI